MQLKNKLSEVKSNKHENSFSYQYKHYPTASSTDSTFEQVTVHWECNSGKVTIDVTDLYFYIYLS